MIISNTFNLLDPHRNRPIPVELYIDSQYDNKASIPVIVLNHGYGVKNTDYTFLTDALASKGYAIISIQQDLEADSPLPRFGNVFLRRKPLWDRGVQNILFTLFELKKIKPSLDLNTMVLIGHSNGGDISMLFTAIYPKRVQKVISLDSLRYPFPTKNQIPILSLRATDTQADEGVIPSSTEKYIHIVPIKGKHNDMYDAGPEPVKKEIIEKISEFLET